MSLSKTDLSAEAVQAWRLLRDQGGYWTAGEMAEELLPARADGARAAGRWMMALRKRGCVVVNPNSINILSYGVTGSCHPPEGERMDPAGGEHEQ